MRRSSRISLLTLLVVFSFVDLGAQVPPKRELRSIWIATVTNLDWPTRGADPNVQRSELLSLLDGLKAVGVNSVVFQVRPECDEL